MSQTAISFGIYEEVRDYAELLDYVLVKIRNSADTETNIDKKKLGQFLEDVGNSESPNLTARYIGLVLNAKNRVLRRNLSIIGHKIKSDQPQKIDAKEIRSLEELARFLDGEQAEAAARIRGHR